VWESTFVIIALDPFDRRLTQFDVIELTVCSLGAAGEPTLCPLEALVRVSKGAAFSFVPIFTAASGVEAADFFTRIVNNFFARLTSSRGHPRTTEGQAWGFTTPKGPGRPRTGFDRRSRSRSRSGSRLPSARTWPLDPRPWQRSRSRRSSDGFLRYFAALGSNATETWRTDRMVESTVSTIVGAAGRTEAEITSDTLAKISLVALIYLSAVLTLLWKIVSIGTCEEILEDGKANLVVCLPNFFTWCSHYQSKSGRDHGFLDSPFVNLLSDNLRVERNNVEELENF
jgi:hypothetical protein